MENLRTATKEDFKVNQTLITSEGYKFTILRKYDADIWEARGDAGDVNVYEDEAKYYKVEDKAVNILVFKKTKDDDLKEGMMVAFRDVNGEYTKAGEIQNIIEMDGIKLYDISDCLFAADELKLIATGKAVKVIFIDPQYNYTTSVNPKVSDEDLRKYFVDTVFNVGAYPKELMKKCISIEII